MKNARSLLFAYMNAINSHLIQVESSRQFLIGAIYVLGLVMLSSLWSSSSALDQNNHHYERVGSSALSQGSSITGVHEYTRRQVFRVRRQSTYAITERPTGVISLKSRREQCTGVLIHERVVLTEGVCAQALAQAYSKSQIWTASSKYVAQKDGARTTPARVIKSEVHPRLQLALHLLDQSLPYAPLELISERELSTASARLRERTLIRSSSQSIRHGDFVLSQNKVGMMNLIRGRFQNGQYLPLSNIELAWIKDAELVLRKSVESIPLDASSSNPLVSFY